MMKVDGLQVAELKMNGLNLRVPILIALLSGPDGLIVYCHCYQFGFPESFVWSFMATRQEEFFEWTQKTSFWTEME